MSKVPMSDEHTSSKRRRNILDGGYTVGLLIVAILAGYGVLAPSGLARATTLARPYPVPSPAPVAEYLGRPIERAPEPPRATWPKMVSGQILDASRAPLEGASVVIGGGRQRTERQGRLTLQGHPPHASPLVKRPGLSKAGAPPTPAPSAVVMKPQVVQDPYPP